MGLYPILSKSSVREIDVDVTAAAGSAGQVVPVTLASARVTVANISVFGAIDYKIDAGPWITLETSRGAYLELNLAFSTLSLRKTGLYSPALKARLTLEGVVLGAATSISRPSNVYARKPLGSEKQTGGTSTHQEQIPLPMGSMLVDFQLEVHNDSTSTTLTINDHAFAGGDTFGAFNPSGAWTAGASGLAVPVTANAIRPNVFQTPKQRIFLPPGTDDPKWSVGFTRARFANARIWGSNVPSVYNTVAQKYKSRLDFHAITNITDAFPNPPSGVDVHLRSSIPIITPVTAFSARTCAFIGDSRTRGQGSTSDDYGWAARAVEAIASEFNDLIGYENWGISGTNSTQFQERFTVLMNGSRTPDLIYFQAASSNNTNPWTEATVNAMMVLVANVEAECRRRGVAFLTGTMYASFAADTPEKVAQVDRLNAWLRATFPGRVIDFDEVLTDRSTPLPTLKAIYQFDTQHGNDAGQAVGGLVSKPLIKSGLGLTAGL